MHLRHRLAAALPLAAFALAAPHAAAAQPDVVSITRRASPAVVTLYAYNSTGRRTSLGAASSFPTAASPPTGTWSRGPRASPPRR